MELVAKRRRCGEQWQESVWQEETKGCITEGRALGDVKKTETVYKEAGLQGLQREFTKKFFKCMN